MSALARGEVISWRLFGDDVDARCAFMRLTKAAQRQVVRVIAKTAPLCPECGDTGQAWTTDGHVEPCDCPRGDALWYLGGGEQQT